MQNLYLIAQYMPDLLRREPRNIGVLLYDEGRWSSRFLGESPDGRINGKKVWKRVNNLEAYRQWCRYWRDSVSEGIEDRRGRGFVHPHEPSFPSLLCEASRGNYALVPGTASVFPSEYSASDAVLDHLFRLLVEDRNSVVHEEGFDERMRSITHTYRLDQNPHFRRNFCIAAKVGEEEEELVFPWAYENGSLRLYKHVSVQAQQRDIHHALWTFSQAKLAVPTCSAVALLYTTREEQNDPGHAHVRRLVNQLAETVDVGSDIEVEKEFSKLTA